MTKVHVIGPNLATNSEVFHVHAEGCADVTRSRLYRSPEFKYDREITTAYANAIEMVDDVYADQLSESDATSEEYLSEFKIFPCVPKEFSA